MSNTNQPGSGYDTAKLIRRAIFFVCLFGLSVITLFFSFQGLSSPRAMEQAEIGREIARGNGYSSKVIRPVALWQMKASSKDYPSLEKLPDTYHAPLNPCVYASLFKIIDADNNDKWRMPEKSHIYQLDRIIAVTCTIFFLISIGVNYLLIVRMFDATIAATVSILLLFCELMWQFSQSGLPQMLMMMLFSCSMFFLWRAIENKEDNRSPIAHVLVSGVFMCLLALTHWITIWIYLGYVIFAAIYFKPRGVIAVILLAMLAIFVIPTVYFLYIIPTGSTFGTAYYVIHDGLGISQDNVMRSLSPETEQLGLKQLLLNILATTLSQMTDLHRYLGAIFVAPLFFIALLHPFKRHSLSSFRWVILSMWILASLAMSIYGIRKDVMDPNQIHILFAPIMAAYGTAMISILWARLNIAQTLYSFRHAHLIIIVAISTSPMLLSIPQNIIRGFRADGQGGTPHWPPYLPGVYNHFIADNTNPKNIVISDTPWAVAWYADRMSIWLPKNLEQIEQVQQIAETQQTPVSSILITPYSYNSENILRSVGHHRSSYGELYPLIMGAWAYQAKSQNFIDTDPEFRSLSQRYPHRKPLYSRGQIMFYSTTPISNTKN